MPEKTKLPLQLPLNIRSIQRSGTLTAGEGIEFSMQYLLVDLENVPKLPTHNASASPARIVIFCGKKQSVDEEKLRTNLNPVFTGGVQFEKVTVTGKNALDFQLAYFAGRLAATVEGVEIFVISGDGGFDSLVDRINADSCYAYRFPDLREFLDRPVDQKSLEPNPDLYPRSGRPRLFHLKKAISRMPISERPPRLGILANFAVNLFGNSCTYMEAIELAKECERDKMLLITPTGEIIYDASSRPR